MNIKPWHLAVAFVVAMALAFAVGHRVASHHVDDAEIAIPMRDAGS